MAYIPASKWAHLQQLDVRRVPVMGTNRKGEPYLMDTHGPLTIFFRCDCGFEFSLPRREFPGRRQLTYCGRPECPHAPKPKRKKDRSDPCSVVTVYLPQSLIAQVYEWAKAHDTSFSGAARALLLKGLVDDLVDSD